MPDPRRAVAALAVALWFGATAAGATAAPPRVPLPPRRPGAAPPPAGGREARGPRRPEEFGPPAPLQPGAAGGADVPLPVPRPNPAPAQPAPAREAFGPRRPEPFGPPAPPRPDAPPAPPEPDPACVPLLAGGAVAVERAPPVAEGEGCGIVAPVRLAAVVLRDGRRVPMVPPALMRCDLAQALADWLRDDVAPAAATAEGPLLGVANAAAYACRGRNWAAAARVSEHARGNAVDIVAFRFARRTLPVAAGGPVLSAARGTACARFATVLGPGSDRYHASVLHLDLEHRRNGFRLCQWDLP